MREFDFTCPICEAGFDDGYSHTGYQKLYNHMSSDEETYKKKKRNEMA